jgi:uncharacterized BrkB/YihY/UPF0761 family membrane protein
LIAALFNLSDYLPSFSTTVNMAFSLLAFTPLVAAFAYVLTMLYYRKPPEMLRIAELLIGTFLISVALYACLPSLIEYLRFFGDIPA